MDKIIKNILKKIIDKGYNAYIVGGYVRDYLLGIESNDIDICTNALPKDVIEILDLDKNTNDNYGCINIKTKKYNIDITTFRKESDYDNHSIKNLEYVSDLKADLKRRDFTCNAILMDYDEQLIDYYNGIDDINNKKLKCIGSVSKKLEEDPLRMLRALRFSILYDFTIDDSILKFIDENKNLIKNISYFRKKEELDKILSSKNKSIGLKLIKDLNLFNSLELKYDNIVITNDILGIYAQIEYSENYPFTKTEKDIIKKVREIIKLGSINNNTLYKYGLYINSIAGEILKIDYNLINKKYKSLPIKSKDDIKINIKTIVKLNNNSYDGINNLYSILEENILNGVLKNRNKNIVNFIRKRCNNVK